MDTLDPKFLKKLVDTCRKTGIKTFKGYGIEFTLSEATPVSTYKKNKKSQTNSDTSSNNILTEGLSEEELLFWSTGTAPSTDSA